MSHYGRDMDHDGKITSKDMAMFHEMIDEDTRESDYSHKSLGDMIGESLFLCVLTFAVPILFIQIVGTIASWLS